MIRLWHFVWLLLFRLTPKMANPWRLFLLRMFGAHISGRPFVFSSARIYAPFLLTLDDHSCLGPYSEIYNLGPVHLETNATLSQHVYICNGTHDFDDPRHPLLVGDVTIGRNAFIGAKAFLLPGVNVGADAIVGACGVVTKDVPAGLVVAGNPCKVIRTRLHTRT